MKLNGCWMTILGVFVFGAGLSAWAVAEEMEGLETEAAADPSADVVAIEGVEDVEEAATGTDLALVLPPAPPRILATLPGACIGGEFGAGFFENIGGRLQERTRIARLIEKV